MKPLALIIALFLAVTATGLAQTQEKPQSEKPAEKLQTPANDGQNTPDGVKTTDDAKKELQGFVDMDGDGIDDRKVDAPRDAGHEHKGMMKRERRRDHFIDNDGDGINDTRCNGMGFGNRKSNRRGGGGQK